MSRIDLAAVLTGRQQQPVSPPDTDPVAVVRCPCGGKLATVHAHGTGCIAWAAPRAYTPAHTAAMLLDQALRDLEDLAELAEAGDRAAVDALEVVGALVDVATPEAVARAVRPLRLPATLHDVDAIVAAAREEEARASAHGVVPNHLGALDVPCRTCQRVWYIGGHLSAWGAAPRARARTVIAEDQPPMRAAMIGWPESSRGMRVALYRHMTDVLASASTTA